MFNTLQQELVTLARRLGDPALDLAPLGEGNVSALAGDGTFWVKASGSSLGTLAETDLSCVRLDAVLELLERESMDEAEVEAALTLALVDPAQKKPSVETFLHAICLSQSGAAWVGHRRSSPTPTPALRWLRRCIGSWSGTGTLTARHPNCCLWKATGR